MYFGSVFQCVDYIQEQIAALLERKEKLKEEVASKVEERDHWKTKFKSVVLNYKLAR